MLRVGLTGELGSGKSTVAQLLASYGAVVMSSDELGRELMQPNQAVYEQIVDRFGPGVVGPDGQLDRPGLARLAFDPAEPRVEELNAIVHPAVIAEQERRFAEIAHADPMAIVVVESALIFTTQYAGKIASGEDGAWHKRFDRILVVSAPDQLKIARYIGRATHGRPVSAADEQKLRADALARLAQQRIPSEVLSDCLIIENAGNSDALAHRTEEVFRQLRCEADHRL